MSAVSMEDVPYDANGPRSTIDDMNLVAPISSETFSPTGVMAVMVKQSGDKPFTEPEPVQRWGPAGEPMILWKGAMRDATRLDEFVGLRQGRRVVSVIPGGGWRIRSAAAHERALNEAEGSIHPVIAWAVTEQGQAVPITVGDTHRSRPLVTEPADELASNTCTLELLPP